MKLVKGLYIISSNYCSSKILRRILNLLNAYLQWNKRATHLFFDNLLDSDQDGCMIGHLHRSALFSNSIWNIIDLFGEWFIRNRFDERVSCIPLNLLLATNRCTVLILILVFFVTSNIADSLEVDTMVILVHF